MANNYLCSRRNVQYSQMMSLSAPGQKYINKLSLTTTMYGLDHIYLLGWECCSAVSVGIKWDGGKQISPVVNWRLSFYPLFIYR